MSRYCPAGSSAVSDPKAAADELLNDALARYRATRHHEYEEAMMAAAGKRVDFDFDPPGV